MPLGVRAAAAGGRPSYVWVHLWVRLRYACALRVLSEYIMTLYCATALSVQHLTRRFNGVSRLT